MKNAKTRRICGSLWFARACVFFGILAVFLPLTAAAEPIEKAFRHRLEDLDDQMPTLIESAEASANRHLEHSDALLNVPWENQKTF